MKKTLKKQRTSAAIERIFVSRQNILQIENDIKFDEHLKRYAAARRFCYGKVLDFACGCGYGSFLVSANPEVSKIVGVDKNSAAVNWAKKEFGGPKIEYRLGEANEVNEKFDVLLCLETIEHLKNTSELSKMVERCEFDEIIVSFPDKKSTHFNSFHFHDFVLQDIADIFSGHIIYHSFRSGDVQFVLLVKKPEKAPSHIFRNIKDLK